MELLLDILPDAFPWVRFLPESDLHAFAVELVDTMRAADSVGNSASVAQLLIAWQHTAEVYSDPELLAALTRDHGDDYGPVPDPRGTGRPLGGPLRRCRRSLRLGEPRPGRTVCRLRSGVWQREEAPADFSGGGFQLCSGLEGI